MVMLADSRESWTRGPGLWSPELTDLGLDNLDVLCWTPLGPGTGEDWVTGASPAISCGTGELTQLAVIGLTTERSSSGDLELGLGVSAALVYVARVIGMAENEETEAGAWSLLLPGALGNMAGVCWGNW